MLLFISYNTDRVVAQAVSVDNKGFFMHNRVKQGREYD